MNDVLHILPGEIPSYSAGIHSPINNLSRFPLVPSNINIGSKYKNLDAFNFTDPVLVLLNCRGACNFAKHTQCHCTKEIKTNILLVVTPNPSHLKY